MKTKSNWAIILTTVTLGALVAITALVLPGCSATKTTIDTTPAPDFSDITITIFQSPT